MGVLEGYIGNILIFCVRNFLDNVFNFKLICGNISMII